MNSLNQISNITIVKNVITKAEYNTHNTERDNNWDTSLETNDSAAQVKI